MKRLLTILGASLFLVGCGSQNLGPLEDKTTNLRDENHNLKLKIQQLNQDINNQKSQLEAIKIKRMYLKLLIIIMKLIFYKLLQIIIKILLRLSINLINLI